MFEMHTFKAEELLAFLNDNKGEVIHLEDTHNDYWTLVFRKTVMGRPKREEAIPVIPEIVKAYNEPKPVQFGFPARDYE